MIPFVHLAEFAAHEEKFLARMSVHPPIKHPQVGELLPFVAGHFREERTLQVHDFIVAEHEHEMLAEGIHERERDAVVMKLPEDVIELDVIEEVMHPTHVPVHLETEPAEIRWFR